VKIELRQKKAESRNTNSAANKAMATVTPTANYFTIEPNYLHRKLVKWINLEA